MKPFSCEALTQGFRPHGIQGGQASIVSAGNHQEAPKTPRVKKEQFHPFTRIKLELDPYVFVSPLGGDDAGHAEVNDQLMTAFERQDEELAASLDAQDAPVLGVGQVGVLGTWWCIDQGGFQDAPTCEPRFQLPADGFNFWQFGDT